MRKGKFLKKLLTYTTLAATALSLAGCGKEDGGTDSDTLSVTMWIPRGEDSSCYESYNDNPIAKYIEENYTFNGKKIHVDYHMAPPGSEDDDFSTLLGTGDYCDILDMSKSSSSAIELLEEDIIWDLTELIPQYMPNYMACMEAWPDVERDTFSIVDGDKRRLVLHGIKDQRDIIFEGYCYRRDWIAKYGSNPVTGTPFTGGFEDANDPYSWKDDVVFPNGTDEPLYISDWEWMFEIFTKALEGEGITDGYCYAPYYWGYQTPGDFYSGFGGGAPFWYIDTETDTIVDGTVNDNMRAYLQCLNTWWNKGWLDPAFAEHTSDMFFAVDAAKVFSGKVGLWQGRQSTVGVQIDAGDEWTSGIVVYGARQPINDIYGGSAQQGKTPNASYKQLQLDQGVVLTKKLTEEEVITYLQYADFMYSEEGSLLTYNGFNAEQAQKAQDPFYEKMGLTETGLYHLEERDGVSMVVYTDTVNTGSGEFSALYLNRVPHRLSMISRKDFGFDRYLTQATEAWEAYGTEAVITEGITNAIDLKDQQQMTKIRANLDQFLQRTIPAMIKGEGYDVWKDEDWESYVQSVKKYQSETITEIYNKAYDLVK